MKIIMTFEFDSPEEAAGFMAEAVHSGEHDAPVAGETTEQAAERKKRVRRTKAQIAADEAAAAAAAGQPAPIAAAPQAATPAPAPAPAPSAANVVDFMGGAAAVAAKPAITPEERLRRLVAEVRPAIQIVVDTKGPDVARSVVQHFGVGNLDQIPAERYDDFIAACRVAAAAA